MSVWSIVIAVLMIGLLVTVHELGHFWVARLLKIKAYEVSIFIGPKLVDWRKNDVEYSIRAFPFGAYVRFNDFDENGNLIKSDDPTLLENSPRWKRLIVALAGPFMNLFVGVLFFVILFTGYGFDSLEIAGSYTDSQLSAVIDANETPFEEDDVIIAVNGSRVATFYDYMYEESQGVPMSQNMVLTMRSHTTGDIYDLTLVPEIFRRPMIGITHSSETNNKYDGWPIIYVSDDQNNGHPVLKVGDYLTAINGVSVISENFDEFYDSLGDGDVMQLTYYRNGVEYTEDCVFTTMTYANDRGVYLHGYAVNDFPSFLMAVKYACCMPYTVINCSAKLIGDVFEGQEEVYNMVGGPVGMTVAVSDVVDNVDHSFVQKVYQMIQTAGFISISLMFTNLLPIPGLDGNQLLLLVIEMIMGKTLSKKSEGVINVVGYVLIFGLGLFALVSDIIRIFLE